MLKLSPPNSCELRRALQNQGSVLTLLPINDNNSHSHFRSIYLVAGAEHALLLLLATHKLQSRFAEAECGVEETGLLLPALQKPALSVPQPLLQCRRL